MMLVTLRLTASNRRTSPVEWCCDAEVGAAGGVDEKGVAGEGKGDG